ncbi:hypothetical protein GOODEAATRI_002873 [Goodea atripinnis]|uniref:Ig-like domain-containing protein n=1 Tax=Goodea atripinnis TaxID=208336 RepID=A0ABV0N7E0_9TELE
MGQPQPCMARKRASPVSLLNQQVTWQRGLKPESLENLATYNRRFGQKVNDPFEGKVSFRESSLNSSSIILRNVTWEDENCYVCSFNAYPDGSKRKQICLKVEGILKMHKNRVPTSNPAMKGRQEVLSCSATGKPAPTITWDIPSNISSKDLQQTAVVSNSDRTFTSSSSITVECCFSSESWSLNTLIIATLAIIICIIVVAAVVIHKRWCTLELLSDEHLCEAAVIQTQQTILAAVGEDAPLSCQLLETKDVQQVTWQKVLEKTERNVCTYSEFFGETVDPGFKEKVQFTEVGLQKSSIVIRSITEQDEGCYLCLFNIYPDGALIGRTCLMVYELHEPILDARRSNSPTESVVSCSATGRPAPSVTLTVLHQSLSFSQYTSTSVTNSNGTVTITTTALLSAFSSTEVGCSVSVLSAAPRELLVTVPGLTETSEYGEELFQSHL